MAKKILIKLDKLMLAVFVITLALFTVCSVWKIAVDREWRYLYYPVMAGIGLVLLRVFFSAPAKKNKKNKEIAGGK